MVEMNEAMRRYHSFNPEKVLQALGYIQRETGVSDTLQLIKYLFFADRLHLRRYLSFISKDAYYALKNGPAASQTLNLLNKQGEWLNIPGVEKQFEKILIKKSKREIHEEQTDLLSKNEMDSLDFVIGVLRNRQADIVALSHEYPEWKRYEESFREQTTGIPISVDDFFSNPDPGSAPLLQDFFGEDPFYEDPGYLEEAKKTYHELNGA
jgi:hypothetical protein